MELKIQENQIINGLKAGNENSYNQLFNEYYALLTVFAKKYVKDLEIAREIVQDFYVHIFEIRNTLNITTSLKAYLYQSIKNRCLNYIKQIQIQEKHLESLNIPEISDTDLEAEIIQTELEQQIYQVISSLPVKCQTIFKMRRIDGMKNGEIARQLNLSVRTVETQVSKALKILRSTLQNRLKL